MRSFITVIFLVFAIHLNAEPLLDKIYAVHATRSVPRSDTLQAGMAIDSLSPAQQALWPQIRSTVHFALGELVRPVEGFMDWEECPYAIVTPLRTLLPQLININCYDTFILGDLDLGPETFLLVPLEQYEKVKSKATVIPYTSTLREAVDNLIAKNGGWHIVMDSEDIEDELHPAYLDGKNINIPEFFAPLKKNRPWLSVGLRFDPLEGEHYRLSQIEQAILTFAFPLLSIYQIDLDDAVIKNAKKEALEHMYEWSLAMKSFKWNQNSLIAYETLEKTVKNWCLLMSEELRVRKEYGLSLIGAPDDFLIECAACLDNPALLREFINLNLDRLLHAVH